MNSFNVRFGPRLRIESRHVLDRDTPIVSGFSNNLDLHTPRAWYRHALRPNYRFDDLTSRSTNIEIWNCETHFLLEMFVELDYLNEDVMIHRTIHFLNVIWIFLKIHESAAFSWWSSLWMAISDLPKQQQNVLPFTYHSHNFLCDRPEFGICARLGNRGLGDNFGLACRP